jgi:anti-sigma regulatory factor (Ser/Thr protein kinase)/CheY-like chemotaxis protein
MSAQLRALIVEDSDDDALLLVRTLTTGGYELVYRRVDTPEAMAAALSEQKWDVIISDYVMPRFSGPKALKLAQETGLDVPFIMVSGKMGEQIAVDAMKAGAHDYIMKDRLSRIVPAVERELREADARRQHKQAEEERRRFYRETIVSATGGKLDICDPADVEPYLSGASLVIDVSKPHEVGPVLREVSAACSGLGLGEDRMWEFEIAVGEAVTNALKHAGGGRVYVGSAGDEIWAGVSDGGPGIDSVVLPCAVLRRGFSTKPSMGLGYSIMLDATDRMLLKTGPDGTTVVLVKSREEKVPDLGALPDTWDGIPAP